MKLLFSLFLVVLVHISIVWYNNQPQEAGIDVPAGKLMSLSFAPFREGFSPLEKIYSLPEHINEDLRLLADKTTSIRTYSSLVGLQPTPEFARKYGLKMIQGGWLEYSLKDNRQEMEALIKSANNNPDVVKRVIVGNEVLLRGEIDIDRLISYIREVKSQVKQPVSYADVWSMYMKYPQLFKEVDFITIHILPYWEDEPISVDKATEHLEKVVKQIEDEARGIAPGKPILIGESGWPSTGRQRGAAVPSVVNEAKYIRSLIQVVNKHGFDYNIVEAFNQPWKSNQEGVVGANWGLFSADREAVFPLTGLVTENSHWPQHLLEASILWLLVVARFYKKLIDYPWIKIIAWLAFAQLLSDALIHLEHYLWYTSYNRWQRTYTVILVLINAILAWQLLHRTHDIAVNAPGKLALAERLRFFYLVMIVLAVYKTYELAVNGRYLSFPIEQFVIPVLGVLALMLFTCIQQGLINKRLLAFDELIGWNLHSHRDRLVAYFLILAFFAMIFGESKAFLDGRDFIQAHPGFSNGLPFALNYTFENNQLQEWLFCLLVLSLPFWNNNDIKVKHK